MGEHWYENCWTSQEWRLNHLYWIERKNGPPCRFRLNWAQQELHRNLWHRNNILKARQLGISTYVAMLMLDMCLFREGFHCGIIDKTLPDAQEKMSKISFAFNSLQDAPANGEDFIECELERERVMMFARQLFSSSRGRITATRADFATGSNIRVGTNLRGGTMQLLHVSEFGYVAVNDPKKALKILSGGVNTVGRDGVVIMESTHEGGKYGENYRLTKAAMENVGRTLTPLDFKFFFFPWHKQPEYRVDEGEPLRLNNQHREYFEGLAKEGIHLDEGQKRWYLSQWNTFGHLVKQEYPSTPAEAFETQVHGAVYGTQISTLRAEGRLKQQFEPDDTRPLYVSWDIGLSDYMTLWLIQPGGDGKFYVLDHYSANGKELSHYIGVVRGWEARCGQSIAANFLPHDAAKRDWDLTSFEQRLEMQGLVCRVVPRTSDIWTGIHVTRQLLTHCVFHERCSEPVVVDGVEYMSGVNALENYQTLPPGANGRVISMPLHNACSHSADGFRTFAEAYAHGYVEKTGARARPRTGQRGGMRKGMARGVPWAK